MKSLFQVLIMIITSGFIFSGCSSKWEINNPYENVDWENHSKYKANLHTHTTRSDGRMSPQKVVDSYHSLGYKILAITDHNEVTYPWTNFSEMLPGESAHERLERGDITSDELVFENRNPAEMEIFAIQGNEVSAPHHTGSYFSDYQQQPGDENIALGEIGKKNGLALLNHPGRYTARNPEKYNVSWYVDIFNSYDFLTGMEVYNQGDRYPHDRELWDKVLKKTMPGRNVWGYSNDDFHAGMERLGRNWNVFILPELNEEWIRIGMLEGRFFYVYAVNGHNGTEVPDIKSIEVNSKKATIEIVSSGQDSIRWISGSNIVGRGGRLSLSEIPELSGYVRAEIFGPESVTGTQPFGIRKAD
ncbi:hypothetical protein GM418_27630 [Maribellus comscasis]|uniref:Polymerase/histidinol phosphatase N-terminal domain-containing protein n=1 Tax=Maribellus comscasis TaxID=2681766 RepID=A0A6I6K1M9_9BACT|nr:PHP domain-containing protein [Maribellus comscasis]QGY47300.1 hypothetical protein GM418_27630 [Maribellus comscasis]